MRVDQLCRIWDCEWLIRLGYFSQFMLATVYFGPTIKIRFIDKEDIIHDNPIKLPNRFRFPGD